MAHSTQTLIMAALSTLPSSHLSHLIHSISAVHHRHLRRLAAILSSQSLFTLSLRHLQSLSLHHKSLLIARHLLSNLALLKSHSDRNRNNPSAAESPPFSAAYAMRLRDLDAVLVLLLLCELHHHDPRFIETPPFRWRLVLCNYFSGSILTLSSFGGCSNAEILIQFVECVSRCWNLVNVMGFGEGDNEGKEMAASPAAVVALPSVEVRGGVGVECVICKEDMKNGREVCELPCGHLFHWVCILRWFKKRNTCPCCRRSLPTDDVRREIERLLEDLARIGGGGVAGANCKNLL